jgi:hypothetical protein
MKRLVEDESLQDGRDKRLAELFRVAAPFQVDPFRKRRILVRLERSPVHRSRRFWVRPVVFAALLVSGSAAAAFGHRYITEGFRMLERRGAEQTSAASVAPTTPRPTTVPPVTPSVIETPAEGSDESALMTPEPQPSAMRAKKSGVRVRADGEDATHVVEAIQALRTERDPVRAQALLDEYLKSHPRGVLSGDALALSIEAAAARHDPRAADYARRYLEAYPKGKYRALATRALEIQH